jgi:hypothetical protein
MVYNKIDVMLTSQHSEHDSTIGANRSRTPHINKGPFYAPLLGHISHYALGQLLNQRHLLSLPIELPQCTGLFTKSMGLPCAYKMREQIKSNGVLQLDDIHPHWHILPIAPLVTEPLILEPAIVVGKERPSLPQPTSGSRSRQPQNSTRCDPSAFERSIGKPTKQTQLRKHMNKGKQRRAPSPSSDGHDSEEDALMAVELECLKESSGTASVL